MQVEVAFVIRADAEKLDNQADEMLEVKILG
jgi:hypothetical protein